MHEKRRPQILSVLRPGLEKRKKPQKNPKYFQKNNIDNSEVILKSVEIKGANENCILNFDTPLEVFFELYSVIKRQKFPQQKSKKSNISQNREFQGSGPC